MAVVVKKTSKNFYKVHKVLTPDGKTLDVFEIKNAEPRPDGGVTVSSSLATSISSASTHTVAENLEDVKMVSEDGDENANTSRNIVPFKDIREENEALREKLAELQGVTQALREAEKRAEKNEVRADYWKGQTKRTKERTLRQGDVDRFVRG